LRSRRRELRADTEDGQLTLDGGEEEADQAIATTEVVRARAVLDLARALDDDLEQRGGTTLLAEVELPLVEVLARMEAAGIAADLDELTALSAEYGGGGQQAPPAQARAVRPGERHRATP